MKKLAIIYIGSFLLVFVLAYYFHEYLLVSSDVALSFSLREVYIFLGVFSVALCLLFYVLSGKEKLSDQIGFLYLTSVAIKIIAFSIFFYKDFFSAGSLTKTEGISLLTPMFFTLFFEVIFLSGILKKRTLKKMIE
ncbi:DUF6168 family protein [Aureisphaera galaxeae]|uniref:DUF6168 family protein n=1 Tax=Aureisphaera galaxeae TaxID=1538023 RepID=UPI002350FC3A|nr:DUF6168 family protein [Aureisphaera galaxeae]MDC8005054.1 DUF6168 family protein [Aureisphaera galaxeae]